jgi:histidine triad (HIT) family protein
MDCIFCKIAAGEIPAKKAYEDETIVAFHDLNPQAPVHVLIIPRRHIESLQDVTAEDAAALGHLMAKVPVLARDLGLGERGFRLVANCREEAGQSVWHVHFHLLGGRAFLWPPG